MVTPITLVADDRRVFVSFALVDARFFAPAVFVALPLVFVVAAFRDCVDTRIFDFDLTALAIAQSPPLERNGRVVSGKRGCVGSPPPKIPARFYATLARRPRAFTDNSPLSCMHATAMKC
jgi:hypothetical protein